MESYNYRRVQILQLLFKLRDNMDYSFYKLSENVLNTWGFTYFDDDKEDIKHEVVSFLLEKIHKFEEGKGKAFSYFTIVARNYLILNN